MNTSKTYTLSRNGPLLGVRVAIIGRRHQAIVLRLLVDTGASFTILPVEAVERIGCDTHHPLRTVRIVAANGILVAPVVKVPSFNCLGAKIDDFPVVAHTLPTETLVDGLLGMDFLSRCRAVLDVHGASIRVRPHS
ncbi:MAG: retropepsin-like domain-containing protein [Verrucomicrobia bacterium]|nr:retropepsin-like domain-containing protein [Verrucomicrobiota bacterium]